VLGPLQDNGGPTPTHALLVGSPAIDAGDPAVLRSLDQRGTVRGFFARPTDIGAFEAGLATQFRLVGPANVTAGQPFSLTVVSLDRWGNVASTYTGTVHFSSTDLFAQLPDDTAFSGDDAGTHIFTVELLTPGQQDIEVVDTASPFGSGTVTVAGSDSTSPKGAVGALADGDATLQEVSGGLPNLRIPAPLTIAALAESYSAAIPGWTGSMNSSSMTGGPERGPRPRNVLRSPQSVRSAAVDALFASAETDLLRPVAMNQQAAVAAVDAAFAASRPEVVTAPPAQPAVADAGTHRQHQEDRAEATSDVGLADPLAANALAFCRGSPAMPSAPVSAIACRPASPA
jgi:hypothetical protein